MYRSRHAESLLARYLSLFPCVAITGPRQSGKSTLVRQALPDLPYVSFDDPDEELAFRNDPKGFLGRFPGRVILDEVQRVPELFRYLKISIDAAPTTMGRFVITGSNQLSFGKGVSESLAGRIGLLRLLPFERAELPPELRARQILFGSYPTLAMRNYEGAREWFSSYLGTYLERDIRLVFDIGKLSDFQILLRLLAARTSQEQNIASLAREIGVSSHTVEHWISVLEASSITFSLAPFHANLGKRLIKRPRLYFWDSGLACHLTGLRDMEALEGGPLGVPLFENLVIAELLRDSLHGGRDRDFWFYRDNSGGEIDLIVHDKSARHVSFLEIKSGRTAKVEWAERLERTVNIVRPAFEGRGLSFASAIIYRGQSKANWPKLGFSFVNAEEVGAAGMDPLFPVSPVT